MSTATPDAGGVPVRVGPERRADPVIWNVTRGARFAFTWALARVANIGHRSAERS